MKLPGEGSTVIVPKKAFGLNDLSALTAETGDEFAIFTTGGRRLIIRGGPQSVPLGPAEGADMAAQGWRFSAHSHPGLTPSVLRSSEGDRAVLTAFEANQEMSAIVNSVGAWGRYSSQGDYLADWLPK